MAHAQTVDILNSMDSKQRKKLCTFCIGSSTAEMSMQLRPTPSALHNFTDRDLYLNTMRHNDQAISSHTVDLPIQRVHVTQGECT